MQLPLPDERAPELGTRAFCPKPSRAYRPVSAADGCAASRKMLGSDGTGALDLATLLARALESGAVAR